MRVFAKLTQWWCGLKGHTYTRHFDVDAPRIYLKCPCGAETPGIRIISKKASPERRAA